MRDAVAPVCWRVLVGKQMPEVCTTGAAEKLYPVAAIRGQRREGNPFGQMQPKRRETATCVEAFVGGKQRCAATGAQVNTIVAFTGRKVNGRAKQGIDLARAKAYAAFQNGSLVRGRT